MVRTLGEGRVFYRKYPDRHPSASLFRRLLTATLTCALLVLFAWQLEESSPEARLARTLLGEHWYRLSLDGRHLGYWHTHNYRDESGNWVFDSEQRFALNPYDPVSTTAHRIFAAAPPHALIAAEHLQQGRQITRGLRIEAGSDGYVARRIPADGSAAQSLEWSYDLARYLEFELWLDAEQPGVGAHRTVDTLDFDRSALVARSFDVVSRAREGYVVENAAPYAATRIELDDRYVPRHIRVAGLFDLDRVPRSAALAPRSALQAASYFVPADRRLSAHTRISRLVLAISGTPSPRSLFPDATSSNGSWRLELSAPPLVGGPVRAAQREQTVALPSHHPDITALAARVVADSPGPMDQVAALTEFVHGFLSYRPGMPSRGVLELLDDPRGDCTEFADLLTTLARSLNIPARTVFGLAYADGPAPAFAYHAWNELFVDGAWQAVDPTWGQLRVDATHIPLPTDEAAALTLLTGSVSLAFSVLEVDYFDN